MSNRRIGMKERSRHGLVALKARVKVRGLHAIDMRTAAAQGLIAWRSELVNALGGEGQVTPQRLALIDMAVRTRLFIDHVDSFLMEQSSLVNRRRKSVLPVLRERQSLCDSLAKLLSQLGLDRVAKEVPSLQEYLAENYDTPARGETPAPELDGEQS
jgi:hypothetical protein